MSDLEFFGWFVFALLACAIFCELNLPWLYDDDDDDFPPTNSNQHP